MRSSRRPAGRRPKATHKCKNLFSSCCCCRSAAVQKRTQSVGDGGVDGGSGDGRRRWCRRRQRQQRFASIRCFSSGHRRQQNGISIGRRRRPFIRIHSEVTQFAREGKGTAFCLRWASIDCPNGTVFMEQIQISPNLVFQIRLTKCSIIAHSSLMESPARSVNLHFEHSVLRRPLKSRWNHKLSPSQWAILAAGGGGGCGGGETAPVAAAHKHKRTHTNQTVCWLPPSPLRQPLTLLPSDLSALLAHSLALS